MKKIVSLILLLSMIVCMIPAVSLTASAETTVNIGSYAELTNQLSAANSATETEYKLTANIDCGGKTLDGAIVLKNGAVLNGNGFAITNFSTTSGILAVDAGASVTVKDVTFTGTATGTSENVALLIADTDATISFKNCHVDATATAAANASVAGFIANYRGTSLSFDGCTVNGMIENTASYTVDQLTVYPAAGFVAKVVADAVLNFASSTNNASVSSTLIAGGFVGYAGSATVTATETSEGVYTFSYVVENDVTAKFIACSNTGAVTGEKAGIAAGFFAAHYGTGKISIDRSINSGAISQATYVAGFVGHSESANTSISFSQNSGLIEANDTSASHVGGFTGRIKGKASFISCINTGDIFSVPKIGNVGQIASKVDTTATFENCYALGSFALSASAINFGPVVGAFGDSVILTAKGNKYVAASYTSYHGVDQAADLVSAADVESLKANILMKDENGDSIIGAPAMRGVQETAIVGGKHSVRLLAAVDTANYTTVGMTVTTRVNGEVKRQDSDLLCSTLYKAVTAVDDKDGTIAAHKAEDAPFSGKYLMALCLTNVPTTKGVVEIVATPYGIAEDGTRYEGTQTMINYVYSADGKTVEMVLINGVGGEGWTDAFGANIPQYTDGVLLGNVYTQSFTLGQTTPDPDTFKMFTVTGTTSAKYEAYIDTLENSPLCTVTDASDEIEGVSGYWVETDGIRMYTYMVSATGTAYFMLENSPRQTMPEEFNDGYNYTGSGDVTFYLYGLTNDDVGINIGWEKHKTPEELTHSSVDNARREAYRQLLANSPWLSTTNYQNQFKNNGMMLVVKLADNSVIIIDGGHEAQMSDEAAIEFNDFLHNITGTAFNEKVTIKAWYNTHPDGDHYQGFIRFMCSFHGQYNMERVMFNLSTAAGDLRTFLGANYLMKWYPDLKFHRLHTGETIKLGGVEIDVLYTREDCAPANLTESGKITFSDGNDASNLLMFRFDGIKVMVTGDMGNEARDRVLSMYSGTNALAADVFQSPHHVINDSAALCMKVRPTYILNAQSYGGAMYGGKGGWYKNYINNLKSMNTSLSDAQKAANNYFAGGTTSMDADGNVWQVTTSTGISAKNGKITVNVVSMDVKKPGWNGYPQEGGANNGQWINGDWDTFSAVKNPKDIIDQGWGDEFGFGN